MAAGWVWYRSSLSHPNPACLVMGHTNTKLALFGLGLKLTRFKIYKCMGMIVEEIERMAQLSAQRSHYLWS